MVEINQVPTEMVEKANSEEELYRIENDYWVNLAKDLESLEGDKRFQNVIMNGYFKDKAVNGVSMLAADQIVRNGLRPDVMEQLIAISQLQDYFMTIKNLGTVPEEDTEDSKEV